MDKQTIELLKDLYKKQKQADISNNFTELNKINKQIFAINEQEEKERKRLLALERDDKLAERIERRLTEKGLEQ